MSNRIIRVRRSRLTDMIASSILASVHRHQYSVHRHQSIHAIGLRMRSDMQSPDPTPLPQYIEAKCEGKIDDCSICLNEISIDEHIIILPCCHRYHKQCIIQWFNQRNTCPICREPC
jgi:hypothetical protein